MQFRLPFYLRRQIRRARDIPAGLRRLQIPGSEALCSEFPGGLILSQELRTQYFALWVHHFLLDAAVIVEPKTDAPIVTLAFIRDRPVPCVLQEFGEVLLSPDQYHLFYVPSISGHEAALPAGHTVAVHINYDPRWLKRMAGRDPVLQQLILRAEADAPAAYRYYPVDMEAPVRKVIGELIDLREPDPVLRSLFIEEKSSFLIRHYGAALVSGLAQ